MIREAKFLGCDVEVGLPDEKIGFFEVGNNGNMGVDGDQLDGSNNRLLTGSSGNKGIATTTAVRGCVGDRHQEMGGMQRKDAVERSRSE